MSSGRQKYFNWYIKIKFSKHLFPELKFLKTNQPICDNLLSLFAKVLRLLLFAKNGKTLKLSTLEGAKRPQTWLPLQ